MKASLASTLREFITRQLEFWHDSPEAAEGHKPLLLAMSRDRFADHPSAAKIPATFEKVYAAILADMKKEIETMTKFKPSEKRYQFMRWAGDWCKATGTQLCGKEWEDDPDETGSVSHLAIRVLDTAGFRTRTNCVTLYPGAVAEVCGYIPRGFRHGHTARFVKGGDLMVV